MLAQLFQLRNRLRGHIIELMGVYADGSVDVVIFFSQMDAHFGAFHITADIDDIAYPARRKKLPQELLSVLLESLVVIMCVRIKIIHN